MPDVTDKPYSESCDQNREPILAVLSELFIEPGLVLEIGSGTGQHAAWMPGFLPQVTWQPSDVADNLPGIHAWCQEAQLDNVLPALELDVTQAVWPLQECHYVYSANTAHIMAWDMVQAMFAGVGDVLLVDGLFCLYGPFNYDGQFSSDSNARFEGWLKKRDPQMGIRDLEDLKPLAQSHGMNLVADIEMPVNNRILVFQKQ